MRLTHVTVETVEPSIVALDIEVPAEEVEQVVKAVYRDFQQRTHIPGFRKGKAPIPLLKRQVGGGRIRREVIDRSVSSAYDQALKEQSLEPLEQANLETIEYNEDGPLRFKARVMVKPQVTLGEYKGLSILKPKVEVTDEEVEQQLTARRERRATFNEIQERGIQKGDVVGVELEVYVDGALHRDGRQRLNSFVVGENNFVPAIDDPLLGARVGEERRFPVSYPSDFKDADLAGKDAEFLIHILSVTEKVLPELNDELAEEMGKELAIECSNVEQLRQGIRQRLLEAEQSHADQQVRERVAEAVVANASVGDIPNRLIERRTERLLHNTEERLNRSGVTLETFAALSNATMDELRARYRDEAERELKQGFALEVVAKREGITVTPEDVEPDLTALAEALKQDVDFVRQRMTENGTIQMIELQARERKTIDWLVNAAHITVDS